MSAEAAPLDRLLRLISERVWHARAALALVILIVYGASIGFESVGLDDPTHLFDNPGMINPTGASLVQFLTAPFFFLFVPVTYGVWWILSGVSVYLTGGLSPSVFHAASVFMHFLNTCLVLEILTRLHRILLASTQGSSRQKGGVQSSEQVPVWAVVSAMAFAVHPVQVESVAWISGMKDLLSGFFALWAILLLLGLQSFNSNDSQSPSKKWAAIFLFVVLSVLSKPATLLLPAFLWFCQRLLSFKRLSRWGEILFYGAWGAGAVALILVTRPLQPASQILTDPDYWLRPLVASYVLFKYCLNLIFPWGLIPDYGISMADVLKMDVLRVAWLFPLALFFLLRQAWKRDRRVRLGAALFVVCVFPVMGWLNFEFQNFSVFADRYLYLAMVGVVLILSPLFNSLPKSAIGAVLVIWSGLSFAQTQHWRDSESIFLHTVVVQPDSYLAQYGLATFYFKKNDPTKVIQHAIQALRIKPNALWAMEALIKAYFDLGRFKEAEGILSQIFGRTNQVERMGRKGESFARLRNFYGAVLQAQGRTSEAMAQFEAALELNPNLQEAQVNLGALRTSSAAGKK